MPNIARYFMERRLGRGVVVTTVQSDGSATIELKFGISDEEQRQVKLTAPSECVNGIGLMGDELLYRLSRHAILQVQQLVQHRTPIDDHLVLSCSLVPWNGDLTEAPYNMPAAGDTGDLHPALLEKSAVQR